VPLEDVERPTRHTGLLGYLVMVWRGFVQFVGSVWLGTKLVFSHRRFICVLQSVPFVLPRRCSRVGCRRAVAWIVRSRLMLFLR
jgi:hypothetical protein